MGNQCQSSASQKEPLPDANNQNPNSNNDEMKLEPNLILDDNKKHEDEEKQKEKEAKNVLVPIEKVRHAWVRGLAPDFTATAYYENEFKKITLSDFLGKYLILFFYPADFTFVCPTEIIEFSKLCPKFRENECEVLGCSEDSHYIHLQYSRKPKAKGGLGPVLFPLISDANKVIARLYGTLIEDGSDDHGFSLRATFIIDKKGIIRHISMNDLGVGRNVDEYLRLVQGFKFTDDHGDVCPSKWKPGGKTLKPNMDSAENKEYWKTEHAK